MKAAIYVTGMNVWTGRIEEPPRNRWRHNPHIRMGDPCHDCGVPMVPASRYYGAITIPDGYKKHRGNGLCGACTYHRRYKKHREATP